MITYKNAIDLASDVKVFDSIWSEQYDDFSMSQEELILLKDAIEKQINKSTTTLNFSDFIWAIRDFAHNICDKTNKDSE